MSVHTKRDKTEDVIEIKKRVKIKNVQKKTKMVDKHELTIILYKSDLPTELPIRFIAKCTEEDKKDKERGRKGVIFISKKCRIPRKKNLQDFFRHETGPLITSTAVIYSVGQQLREHTMSTGYNRKWSDVQGRFRWKPTFITPDSDFVELVRTACAHADCPNIVTYGPTCPQHSLVYVGERGDGLFAKENIPSGTQIAVFYGEYMSKIDYDRFASRSTPPKPKSKQSLVLPASFSEPLFRFRLNLDYAIVSRYSTDNFIMYANPTVLSPLVEETPSHELNTWLRAHNPTFSVHPDPFPILVTVRAIKKNEKISAFFMQESDVAQFVFSASPPLLFPPLPSSSPIPSSPLPFPPISSSPLPSPSPPPLPSPSPPPLPSPSPPPLASPPSPYLPGTLDKRISAEGTTLYQDVARLHCVPRGAALLTSSGKLIDSGIQAILHAASGSWRETGPHFIPTIEGVELALRNCFILARKNNLRSVAMPFIGAGIFLNKLKTTKQILIATIVSAASPFPDVLITVAFINRSDYQLCRRILASSESHVTLVEQNLLKIPGVSAIINAANMEVIFGTGVSGIIGKATGAEQAINAEARKYINLFIKAHAAEFLP